MSRKMTMKSIRNVRKHALPSNADMPYCEACKTHHTDGMFCDAEA